MGDFFGIFGDDENKKEMDERDTRRDGKLSLREEHLDVTKNKEQAGEVTLSKEIIEEKKTVDIPVIREEVVIERRKLDNEPCDSPITSSETIRIPVSKEHVNIDKHTVITGEITAHKHDVEETQHIEETLKREEARIDTEGDANVITDESEYRG